MCAYFHELWECGNSKTCVVSCSVDIPSKPGYLAKPGRDTEPIEVLEGTELTVECVANTSFQIVLYSWTYPSGTGLTRCEYFNWS